MIASISRLPSKVDTLPTCMNGTSYKDIRHISEIIRQDLANQLPSGAGTVPEGQALATAARDCLQSISRAKPVEGGPTADKVERPKE